MGKKSKKAERKKKKRQERIRQQKHARRAQPVWVKEGRDDGVEREEERSFVSERWLRAHALRTGDWLVGEAEMQAAAAAADALTPMIGPGESLEALASERAQELAYQAMETDDQERSMELAQLALDLDPACIDALRLRNRLLSDQDPVAARDRLLGLIERFLPAIDQQQYERTNGRLSRLVNARPVLRLFVELAEMTAVHQNATALVAVLKRIFLLDHLSGWYVAGATLSQVGKDERWRAAHGLRDVVTTRDVGRLALGGVLAWHQADRKSAAELLHQAFRMNPWLRRRIDSGDFFNAHHEMELAAAAIAAGLAPLVDDLAHFFGWLDDGMPWMDATTEAEALAVYHGPMAALLTLGEPKFGGIDAIDYRAAHGIEVAHRPLLERMLGDDVFNHLNAGHPATFAPVHAWRALGQLRDPQSLPMLFGTLLQPDVGDWDYEELPAIIGRFGAAALPTALAEHLRRYVEPESEADVLALQRILALIVEQDATTREVVIERLRWVVVDRQAETATQRAAAIEHLSELRVVECLPLIEQAYADAVVDTSYTQLANVRQRLPAVGS